MCCCNVLNEHRWKINILRLNEIYENCWTIMHSLKKSLRLFSKRSYFRNFVSSKLQFTFLMKKIKKINLQTVQRWILKNNYYFYNILWFNQSRVHDSYIERNNFYNYDVITNFLNIHKKEQEFSSASDEQKIEINIFR